MINIRIATSLTDIKKRYGQSKPNRERFKTLLQSKSDGDQFLPSPKDMFYDCGRVFVCIYISLLSRSSSCSFLGYGVFPGNRKAIIIFLFL